MKFSLYSRFLMFFTLLLVGTNASFAYDLIVAKDGTGDYTTVQAAINAAPTGRTAVYTIFIKNGTYRELVTVPSSKPFIQLVGESVANTIITYNNGASTIVGGVALGTSNSSTVIISASDFSAMNITFQNGFGDGSQAVAVQINADRAAFVNCRFLGNQDTLYTKGSGTPRHYFKNCYIDGNVDFIFGSSIAIFDSCIIYAKTRTVSGSTGTSYITAANTPPGQAYGYVFRGCKLPRNIGVTSYYLGRPWQNAAGASPLTQNKVVYLNTQMGGHVYPAGWVTWDAGTDTSIIYFGEYQSVDFNGNPVDVSQRVTWSHQLNSTDVAAYTISNLFSGWDPTTLIGSSSLGSPIAVSNFAGVKGVSTSSFSWNISWPIAGVTYDLYRSTDGITYSIFNTTVSANDTNINFSTSDAIPPAGSIYKYFIRASKLGYSSQITDTIQISSAPTITITGAVLPLTQYLGTPSGAASYTLTGVNLATDITVTPPANFEVSANGGTTWFNSTTPLVVLQSGGSVSATISVRLNASANGAYSGNVVHTSTGAVTVNAAISGTTSAAPSYTLITLKYWPFSADNNDSADVRAPGVVPSATTLRHLYPSISATPPAYSPTFGQALSANSGATVGSAGDGYWTNGTSHDGPGGNLQRTYYEEFTITPQSTYTLRVDSFILNAAFYGTSSTTTMMAVYSKSNFTLDSTNVVGYSFTTAGDMALANQTGGPVAVWRLGLLTGGTGVTVNAGDTLRMRLYFTCSSSSAGKYACIKNVYFKGLSTACVSQPSDFTASTPVVCAGQTGVTYTVPADPAATSYTWTYSGTGASFTSTSNTVSVDFATTATTGTLSVVANAACGSSSARTTAITVNALPVVDNITGASSVCVGASTTLANTTASGSWSSSNTTVATIDGSGVVYGTSAGTSIITYSSGSGACTASDTAIITVAPIPVVAAITGATQVCVDAVAALSNSTTGGLWSSADGAIATVSAGGEVSGVGSGTTTISYSYTSGAGCSASVTLPFTVNALPVVTAITGTTNVCVGYVTTLGSSTPSGIWSSSDNLKATVSAAGIVTGVAAGTADVSYSVTNLAGCTALQSQTVTVNAIPVVSPISGAAIVCLGATTSLSDATTGGVWSSSDLLIAGINSSGVVNGVSAGSTTITYTYTSAAGCTAFTTSSIVVNSAPDVVAPLNQSLCAGATTSLVSFTSTFGSPSYTWSNSNTGIGLTASGAGNIAPFTAVNATAAPINATIVVTPSSGSCPGVPVSFTITVKPMPVLSSTPAPAAICSGSLFSYVPASATSGAAFSWSRVLLTGISNPAATGAGNPNEILIGNAAAPVAVAYIYTITAAGCTSSSTVSVTVKPTPVLNNVTTVYDVCDSATFSFIPTSATSGTTYTWSRPTTSGVVPASASGTGTINEIISNSTNFNVGVIYQYTLAAGGCTNGQSISLTVHPSSRLSSSTSFHACSGSPVNYLPASFTPGTTFTWTRASVAGITPATGSGSGTISEVVTDTTSSAITVPYVITLTRGGCSNVVPINIVINTAAPKPVIATKSASAVCENTLYQNFGAANAPSGVVYSWTATNASVYASGSNKQYSLVNFIDTGNAVVILTSTSGATTCTSKDTFAVHVSPSTAENPGIIFSNGRLICTLNGVDVYTWGVDNINTLDSTLTSGVVDQSYYVGILDPASYYWVITSKDGCSKKGYYINPVGITNTNDVDNAPMEIYPNPANDIVTVKLSDAYNNDVTVEIVNMIGQKMSMKTAINHVAAINVAGYPSGYYIINCYQNNAKVATGKMIKN